MGDDQLQHVDRPWMDIRWWWLICRISQEWKSFLFVYLGLNSWVSFFSCYMSRWKMERTATFWNKLKSFLWFLLKDRWFCLTASGHHVFQQFPSILLRKLTFRKYTGLARVIGGTSHSKVQWQGRMRYKSILRDSVCLVGGCEWDLSSYITRAGMSPEMVVSRFDIPKLETRLRLPHKAEASTAPHVFSAPFLAA